jgi:GT2 family glycosyltransferase
MNEMPLNRGLSRLTYVYMPQHAYLAAGFERPEGPNIGSAGEHLTIMFLSMNRVRLSERLCSSIVQHIPQFKGEILAVDNGSDPDQLHQLEKMLDAIPLRTRIVRLGRNYGPAGGRNRGVKHVGTDWVMSVDNDIYFTRDPLRHWQGEMAAVGCRFFSLAMIEHDTRRTIRGGSLNVEFLDGEMYLTGRTAGASGDHRELAGEVFLGTYFSGGACIFDVDRFQRLGGFDENMFVGFEDFELSLRLFREGYKVGCSALAALVHDHVRAETAMDKAYEQIRHHRGHIRQSADHFERKHGFKVWNEGVDAWLNEREAYFGLAAPAGDEARPSEGESEAAQRRRLLLVPDVADGALYDICVQIEKHLAGVYDIDIVASCELDHLGQLALLSRGRDLVHVLHRPSIEQMFRPDVLDYAKAVGFACENDLFRPFISTRVTTAIGHHLIGDGRSVADERPVLRDLVDGYYTCSPRLTRLYNEIHADSPPMGTIQGGVDTTLFRPQDLDHLKQRDRALIVGWVGNSRWAADLKDVTGLRGIILPAVEQLEAEGVRVETRTADRRFGVIPHSRMLDFYHDIDVLVCGSTLDGIWSPVLEAMACGVAVISTDVGLVHEALGPTQSQFVLKERSIGALKAALRKLVDDRDMLAVLSAENLEKVKAWDWGIRIDGFRNFFDLILARPPKWKQPLEPFRG